MALAEIFSKGDQVVHKLFGKGIILTAEGGVDNTKLTIEFKGKIRKVIMSKFVKHA